MKFKFDNDGKTVGDFLGISPERIDKITDDLSLNTKDFINQAFIEKTLGREDQEPFSFATFMKKVVPEIESPEEAFMVGVLVQSAWEMQVDILDALVAEIENGNKDIDVGKVINSVIDREHSKVRSNVDLSVPQKIKH